MKHNCPVCQKKVETTIKQQHSYFPFCSQRCKLIDLGAWLDVEYRIVSTRQSQESDEPIDVPSTVSEKV
jgi:endogenous inhibitor of DNA gyrase (YacG/DUF329 family)